MQPGIIILVVLFLGIDSGEISTNSSLEQAPAAAPHLPGDAADSPPIHAPTPEFGSPSQIEYSSPPKPDTEYSPSPSPSPSDAPSPSPSSSLSPLPEASDLNHIDLTRIEKKISSGGGGISGGKKAGVAFGVIAAVCVVGIAGFVYKKRQENIRRSRYGYAAREICRG